MSYFDDASLVMIPSGYKDGKVYSVKPTDGSGDLTFSRGSDIEATRVNANGYIEKAQVNLLLQSNTFSNAAWESNTTNREATLTSGQTGYDGSSDAWLLLDTTGSGQHQIASGSLTLGGVYTSSVYAKAYSSSRYLGLAGFGLAGANEMPVFDLVNGTVDTGTTSTYFIDANIESAGSGWYRCSVTFKYTGTSQLSITLCDTATDNGLTGYVYTGTGTNGIYIQDAQINYGLVAQTYQETTTAAVVSGITDNMPRLNYDPANPTCPSLLLEPSRQNLVESTEFFGTSNWTLSGSAITTNATTSPEGVANATKLEGDGSSVNVRLYDNYSYPSTGDYTFSVYAKAGTNDFVLISILGVDGGKARYFDLVNGIAGSTDSKIEAIGADGWYRCSFTATLTGPDITGNFNIYVPYSINTTSFPTAGDANGQYVYIYGAQLEQASYESSYIPTYGSSATRTADACSLNPSSLLGATQGSWFMELDDLTFETTGTSVPTAFIGADVSNCLAIEARSGGQYKNIFFVKEESGSVTNLTAKAISTTLKACFVWNGTSLKCFVDGVKAYDAGGFTQPSNWNVWSLNSTGREAQQFIKQEILFPTALSDADAITLTSL